MAYIVMAYIVMAYLVTAYIVMAYTVMAYIVMPIVMPMLPSVPSSSVTVSMPPAMERGALANPCCSRCAAAAGADEPPEITNGAKPSGPCGGAHCGRAVDHFA